MLTTALQPYNGIADLFILDPDGYTIRKWNSEELNVGVLSGKGTTLGCQIDEYTRLLGTKET